MLLHEELLFFFPYMGQSLSAFRMYLLHLLLLPGPQQQIGPTLGFQRLAFQPPVTDIGYGTGRLEQLAEERTESLRWCFAGPRG